MLGVDIKDAHLNRKEGVNSSFITKTTILLIISISLLELSIFFPNNLILRLSSRLIVEISK